MSDIQKIIRGITVQMKEGVLTVDNMIFLNLVLDGIPEYYHKDAVLAAFSVHEEEEDKDAE